MNLAWLLDPIAPAECFANDWERKPLIVSRRRPEYFRGLLSLGALDQILASQSRRYPEVMLKDARRDLDAADYTHDGETLDLRRLYGHFANGATISAAFLDGVWPPLERLCRGLEEDWNCPFQANVYLTPAGAQGAKPHYDTHDVFVLQAEGSKHWRLFGTPVETPLTAQEFDPEHHPLGPLTEEFDLSAGDTAYIPRGLAHEAQATGEISLHITVGALGYTWAQALLEMVSAACSADPSLRRSLPPDFARANGGPTAELTAQLRDKLRQVADQRPAEAAEAAIAALRSDFLNGRRANMSGQLEQIAALARLSSHSLVQRRFGAEIRLRRDGESAAIESGDQTIRLPIHAAAAAERAFSGKAVRVGDLPGLDGEGQITLARRLIREGLLTQVARRGVPF